MNLLPVPRTLELTEEMVAEPPTAPPHSTDRCQPRATSCTSTRSGVELVGGDDAGVFYGEATLAQLARLHGGALPAGQVRDHPDLPVRGVMLDVSRDKVPTMATLTALVDRLASLKVNQVQLYSEHTFAYRNHPEVHAAASPYDAAEISELDAFCRARHVELVPNQNCLGHMNRWLAHDRYRPLAIAPDGFVDPFGIARPPMTIEPANPGSLALVRELLAELLPLFSSRRVHVGLDEAWELPASRIDDFLSWVATLRALPELDEREMLMWGDMVSGRPDLVASLPRGVTVCEWGYDDWYPFDERCAVLAEAGVPFWVAPGTSSWMSILGRLTNARTTCRRAAAAALAHGGSGYLNTDWGDLGHLQQPVISEPGTRLRRRRLVVPRRERGSRSGSGAQHARLRRRHRRPGRCRARPRRCPSPRHAAVPQHVGAGHEPLLPAAPRRPRPHRGAHVSGARRGRRVPGRRTRRCRGPGPTAATPGS